MVSKSLIHFQRVVCPSIPLDSPDLTYRLIEEISKLKQEIKEG